MNAVVDTSNTGHAAEYAKILGQLPAYRRLYAVVSGDKPISGGNLPRKDAFRGLLLFSERQKSLGCD